MPKQTKHNKNKPAARVAGRRMQKWARALLTLLALGTLLGAAVLVVPVTRCDARGQTRYSAEEFAAAMELGKHGLRLYNLDKQALAGKIHAALPYARVTAIQRGFPNVLHLTVEELVPVFTQEQDGLWWLLSESGRLLEATAQPPSGLMPVTGARLESPRSGLDARWVDAFTAPGDLSLLRDALLESPLWPEITGLRVSTAALPDVLYQGRIRLRLGTVFAQDGGRDTLQQKLRTAEGAIAELNAQNPGYQGVVDVYAPGKAYSTSEWDAPEGSP